MAKAKEDKLSIKQFRDGSSNFWCDTVHYSLNEDGSVTFCSGGINTEEKRDAVLSFIRRNKKSWKERSASIFEQEEKEYSKIGFGKYSQMSTIELVANDKRYAKWLYQNTADKKIKEELKQLLKIK